MAKNRSCPVRRAVVVPPPIEKQPQPQRMYQTTNNHQNHENEEINGITTDENEDPQNVKKNPQKKRTYVEIQFDGEDGKAFLKNSGNWIRRGANASSEGKI